MNAFGVLDADMFVCSGFCTNGWLNIPNRLHKHILYSVSDIFIFRGKEEGEQSKIHDPKTDTRQVVPDKSVSEFVCVSFQDEAQHAEPASEPDNVDQGKVVKSKSLNGHFTGQM